MTAPDDLTPPHWGSEPPMDAPDLKPCPFCGGKAEFSLGKTGDNKDWHYIECSDCEAMGPRVQYADHNIAIKDALAEAWNTRAVKAEAERDAANALLRRITRNVDADGVGTVLIIDLQAARAHLGAKP